MLIWAWRVITLGAFVSICINTHDRGWDFEVFHNAARAALSGVSPYSVGISNGWSYKYPPWSIPLFLPFGLLSLPLAKFCWGLVQCLSLVFVFREIRRRGVPFAVTIAAFIPFWIVIHYHSMSGQITLLVLALAMLGHPQIVSEKSPWKFGALTWALSLKVFSVLPMIRFLLDRPRLGDLLRKSTLAAIALCVLSIPAMLLSGQGPIAILNDWRIGASTSTLPDVNLSSSRAWNNAGLPGAILRLLGVSHTAYHWDLIVFALLAILVVVFWFRYSRELSWDLQWSGWLALSTAVHPLVWYMSYVMAIPLGCFGLAHVLQSRTRWRMVLMIVGIGFTATMTTNTFMFLGLTEFAKSTGLEGLPESISIKAWGVILMCVSVAHGKARGAKNLQRRHQV